MEWNKRWGIAIGVVLSVILGTPAEASPVLRVGIQYVHPGYVVQDSDGYYHGMDTDYMQALAAYAGMECEFIQGSWEECARRLADGEIDVIPGLVMTAELRQTMDFSVLPMGKNNSSLFLRGGVKSLDSYVRRGSPVKIDTLARNLIRLSGFKPDVDIKIEYTGLRPGEKLYEEKLMAEEGLKKTENELIHIGCPIPFDEDEFLAKLADLMQAAYHNRKDIRESVAAMVNTYHPDGAPTIVKDGAYTALTDDGVK